MGLKQVSFVERLSLPYRRFHCAAIHITFSLLAGDQPVPSIDVSLSMLVGGSRINTDGIGLLNDVNATQHELLLQHITQRC